MTIDAPETSLTASHPHHLPLWGRIACFGLALGLHAAGAAVLIGPWSERPEAVANAPVILVELAVEPAAADVKTSDLPPAPQQNQPARPESEPQKTVAKVEAPPAPQADLPAAAQTPSPIEKPQEKKSKTRANLASALPSFEKKAAHAAAPSPAMPARDSTALPNWKSLLVATLERNKRYPAEAEARGDHGVAELAFRVDRRGGVHHPRITRSSGSGALDRETLAMIERAAPLPPPPPEVAGAEIPIVVPIRYSMR